MNLHSIKKLEIVSNKINDNTQKCPIYSIEIQGMKHAVPHHTQNVSNKSSKLRIILI